MKRRRLMMLSWAIAVFAAIIGCTPTPSPSSSQTSSAVIQLAVSAATSLQDALNAIQPSYETANSGIRLVYNFGSSGALQQQIEQGAPVDVFLSASPKQMDALSDKELLLENTRKDLLKNTMVLVAPLNQPEINSFEDLGKNTVNNISIGDPGSVPAGQYSKEILEALNLYDSVQPKLVFARDVRQVLSYVETGNVDAGLVYGSDVKASDRVRVVATAVEDTHSPIIYPGAVIADSEHPDAAKAFVDFLTTEAAIAIFKSYGFLPAA